MARLDFLSSVRRKSAQAEYKTEASLTRSMAVLFTVGGRKPAGCRKVKIYRFRNYMRWELVIFYVGNFIFIFGIRRILLRFKFQYEIFFICF